MKKPLTFESGGSTLDIDNYNLVTFEPISGRSDFERPFSPADQSLLQLVEGGDKVSVTMYADDESKTPVVRAEGKARYYITQNNELSQVVERVSIIGQVVLS